MPLVPEIQPFIPFESSLPLQVLKLQAIVALFCVEPDKLKTEIARQLSLAHQDSKQQ
jgi:hypothetical protein